MTREEIRALWDKIGTDPILTDEEIEYIEMAMEKVEPQKPEPLRLQTKEIFRCPDCELVLAWSHDHCPNCGQKLDWENAMVRRRANHEKI